MAAHAGDSSQPTSSPQKTASIEVKKVLDVHSLDFDGYPSGQRRKATNDRRMVDEADRDGCSHTCGMDDHSRASWLRRRHLGARLPVQYCELHGRHQSVRRGLC
jgi:hypothetical protein